VVRPKNTRPVGNQAKMAGIRPNLAKMARIRLDLTGFGGVQPESSETCSPESGTGDWTLANFLKKIIFSENDFVENILQQKSFYVEINGALVYRFLFDVDLVIRFIILKTRSLSFVYILIRYF